MKKSLISILALLLMVSCQDNVLAPEYMFGADDLYASIESVNATKTVMDENNNILWSEGDQLVAFMKTTLGVKYQIKEQFVGTSTGGFSKIDEQGNGDDLEAGQELDHNIVVYPHSYDVWCMKNDKNTPAESYLLNVIIPETQVYKENSFGIGAFPMIAVAMDNKLTFRNICGGLKLQFKGVDKIKSIRLEGLGNEKISGKSTVVGYVNGSTPVITMANSDQSYTHVTLDCGEGVQLSETTPTTFIIAVPPVEFASGMKITVTDTDGFSKTLTNSSANTIKRSCLTRFPVITYKQDGIFELPEGTLTSHEISAEGGRVEISLTTNQEYEVVIPEDAEEWISVAETKALRNETIVLNIVENNTSELRSAEIIIANTEGVTLQAITISQGAGTVLLSYIDEYGLDHGPGTKIGETIWAPVNCGFHIIDYPYGKLYQWGRKHGQGYDDTDAEHPSGDNIALGPVSNEIGQAEINSGIFYRSSSSPYDWASTRNDIFWNSGSETSPIKTDFDPCPSGWRVPSHAELSELCQNKSSWTTNTLNQNGFWFSGATTYSDNATQIFLPAAGSRGFDDGITFQRGSSGTYWSCDPVGYNAYDLNFGILYNQNTYSQIGKHSRANGYAIRCVQDNSQIPEPPTVQPEECAYIDEYGINQGKGIEIDGIIWAPVNCGYHETDYPYGKLYQWGRKYGQGYFQSYGNTTFDKTVPALVDGPISLTVGQSEENQNIFYTNKGNWLDLTYYDLWNEGDEQLPKKGKYDPCPNGWRVPTKTELTTLKNGNESNWIEFDQNFGRWFCGSNTVTFNLNENIFLLGAGYLRHDGEGYNRSATTGHGTYWSSKIEVSSAAYLYFSYQYSSTISIGNYLSYGRSVRCVQE